MSSWEILQNEYPAVKIILTLVSILLYFLLRRISSRSILRRAVDNSFDHLRAAGIMRAFRLAISFVLILVLGFVWEVSIEGITVYLASFLTIVGVGLFATWSILSNVTASIILFFFFPFRVGSKVKIIDGDNSVEGVVESLSLFSIKIILEDRSEVYYPNNLAMQKGIRHLK